MWSGSEYSTPKEPKKQEYSITELGLKCKCNFHDGYDRDCFDIAVYSLDSTPMCLKHLHVRMRHLTIIALNSEDDIVLSYTFK